MNYQTIAEWCLKTYSIVLSDDFRIRRYLDGWRWQGSAVEMTEQDFIDRSDELAQEFFDHVIGAHNASFFRWSTKFQCRIIRYMEMVSARPIRVWYPGCGGGEEVYSLVMVAKKANLDIRILGTDGSSVMIDKAQRGVYSILSVSLVPSFFELHFENVDNGFRITDDIRSCVRFEQRHLEDTFGIVADIIVSRKLLHLTDSYRNSLNVRYNKMSDIVLVHGITR